MPPKAKVILVEDDKYTRQDAENALTTAGHRILFSASNLAGARQNLDELTEDPDVAIVDGQFPLKPDMKTDYDDQYSGGLFAADLREKFPGTTIVVFSTNKDQQFAGNRFPPEGQPKVRSVIERDLGPFVTSLPVQARR